MIQSANIWLDHISHAAPGKLLRALLVAQQLCSFTQVPALKVVGVIAGQSEAATVSQLTPAGQRIGYPAGPSGDSPAGACQPVTEQNFTLWEKYHGDLHAAYCDVSPVLAP